MEEGVAEKHKSLFILTVERFCEHRLALIALGVIIFFVLLALGARPLASLFGLDPNAQDILRRYGEWSGAHWLGTDEAGRDVVTRLLFGARVSLGVAFLVATSSMMIGVTVGSIAGYFGGLLDVVLMRLTDALLALPIVPILIVMAALDFNKIPLIGAWFVGEDPGVLKMVLVLVLFSWMVQARLVRAAVLSTRHQEFIMAAQTLGMGHFTVIAREILPNVLAPVIVSVTLGVGQAILYEAVLSFLGLGIQPPTPSWGNMMNNALEAMYYAPSLIIIPGLLILIVVMSFNFLGDGLQNALDPKAIRRG